MTDSSRKNELLYRVYAVLFIFFVFALVIAFKVVKISIVEGDHWRAKKEKLYLKWQALETQRGNIYADDGQSLLATSVEFFDIGMDPTVVSSSIFDEGIIGLSEGLAKLYPRRTAEEWRLYIVKKRANKSEYLPVVKNADHHEMEKVSRLPILKHGRLKGGLVKDLAYQRVKPYRQLASRAIGLDREKRRVGLEHSFNRLLKGEERVILTKGVPNGAKRLYIPVDNPTEYEIIKGKDIHTTINVSMQDIVHNELLRGLKEHDAPKGTAVIMEVETGRIVAMSNLSKNNAGEYGEFENFAVAHSSEPGSTMKAASVLALLDDDFAHSKSIVDFSMGKKNFYGLDMFDSGYHNISKSTLREALERSSNVGIASAVDDAYGRTKKWTQYSDKLRAFGLHEPSGIEIDGEPKPFVKHYKVNKREWWSTTIPWMAHGYEMKMTPLQVLRFYNAIANDGKLMDAQLVTGIQSGNKIEKTFQPKVKRDSIASIESIRELQTMLEGVVDNGTGKKLKSKYYRFAGKTGTTKVGYAGDGEVEYNASFVGYWPADAPKYSMIVVVYGLTGNLYYGNAVAGPIFKRSMDWSYAIHSDRAQVIASVGDYKGDYTGDVYGYGADYDKIFDDLKVRYAPSGTWIKGQSGQEGEVLNGKAKISRETMPDLEGMGLRDAVYVLENLGVEVSIDGVGRVTKQSLKSGQAIGEREVKLYLN